MGPIRKAQIGKAQIGNIRGTGDIVAEKVGRGENTYIKIYQREKKPFLIQTFFRLHDSRFQVRSATRFKDS